MSDSSDEDDSGAEKSRSEAHARVMAMSTKNKERAPPFTKVPADARKRHAKVSHAAKEKLGTISSAKGKSAQDRIDQFNKSYHNIFSLKTGPPPAQFSTSHSHRSSLVHYMREICLIQEKIADQSTHPHPLY